MERCIVCDDDTENKTSTKLGEITVCKGCLIIPGDANANTKSTNN
jgi:hypothetical protein